MVKKVLIFAVVIAVLLGCAVAGAFAWQNEKMQEAERFYGSFVMDAYGVYLNLKEYMQGDDDAQVAMSTAKTYLNVFMKSADMLKYANGDHSDADWYIDFKAALDVAYIKFQPVSDCIASGEQISDSDQDFLSALYSAFDGMQNALRNQDGSLKWELLKNGYIVETIKAFTAAITG